MSRKSNSRSARLSAAMTDIHAIEDRLRDEALALLDNIDEPDLALLEKVASTATSILSNVDSSAVQELYDEIDSWKSNLEGTNLENTSKYSELEECCDALQELIDGIDDIESKVELGDDVKTMSAVERREAVVDHIEGIIDELESLDESNVMFPGMF